MAVVYTRLKELAPLADDGDVAAIIESNSLFIDKRTRDEAEEALAAMLRDESVTASELPAPLLLRGRDRVIGCVEGLVDPPSISGIDMLLDPDCCESVIDCARSAYWDWLNEVEDARETLAA